MTRWKWLLSSIVLVILIGWFIRRDPESQPGPVPAVPSASQEPLLAPKPSSASESLLAGYGDPASEPIEDLRKLHHVLGGYFSVIKDSSHFPIGGNADLAAALRGENPNRTVFLPADHPIFSADGLLIDRWKSPLIVHPEGWRQIGLRSAGPDRKPYTGDDLILTPAGLQPQ